MYRRRQGVTEIFFIKDPFAKWTFPKGHLEEGESLGDAAIRECKEEAGLTGLRYVMPLGRTSFRFRRQGVMVQKTVHFFLLEAPPNAKEHFPTREELPEGKEPIFEGKWVRTHQVFHVSSYKNSDRLLARALRALAPKPRGHLPERLSSHQQANTQTQGSQPLHPRTSQAPVAPPEKLDLGLG